MRAKLRLLIQTGAIVGMWSGLPGCYHHVVRSDGIGTGNEEVYEPNLKLDSDRQSKTVFDKNTSADKK